MKKEMANGFVEKLNAHMGTIENIIRENLGVETKLTVKTYERYGDVTVTLEEDGDATTRQLTATPLLRQMFKEACLWVRCWYDEDADKATFGVHISYDHSFDGGSNGLLLMKFDVDGESGEVTAIEK